jgi:AraC-like DNA-binding protein
MAKRARTAAPGFTVSAELIRGLIDCAATCGLPRARFADLLRDRDSGASPARYAGQHILKLWERVLRLSGDPIIGFRMARVAGLKTFGVLGQIAPRCATVFDAYRQTERYTALASQAAHISVERDAKALTVALSVDVPAGPVRDNILLWGLTNWSLLPQRLTGAPVRPRWVACAFAPPDAAATRTLKQHCPFHFGAERCAVVFDRSVGDLAVPSADEDLGRLLTEAMDRHLAELGPAASFEHGVAAILREMLDGTMPTLAGLSARAGVSQRTLQRRLGDAKTSFQALLQRVLHERADDLLARGNLTQGEIAFVLGYSEVSAFSRAYRGWTGRAPGAARA